MTTSCNSLSWFEFGFAPVSLAGLLSAAPFSGGSLPVTALSVFALPALGPDAPRMSSIRFPLPYNTKQFVMRISATINLSHVREGRGKVEIGHQQVKPLFSERTRQRHK